jgi:hypothetical protein
MLRSFSFKEAITETKLTNNFEHNADSNTLVKDFVLREEPTSDTSTSKKEKLKRLSLNTFSLRSLQNNN